MRVFRDDAPGAGSTEFQSWLHAHADGFFVNITGRAHGRLHRGNCGHMIFRPGEPVNLVKRPKWAADTRRELEEHAREEGVSLRLCSNCDV